MKEQLAKEIRSKLSGGQGYEHFSPSSLNIPIQKYIISYVASTQESSQKPLKKSLKKKKKK
mgnify:CR=1 FL=1